jgi:hypothetical protein
VPRRAKEPAAPLDLEQCRDLDPEQPMGRKPMLFFGPALFGAGCACWLAGVTILYGALLPDRRR